jgi:hypothetical protein
MAYVSHDLTHFVGRSLASHQLRYELLSTIIRNGRLLDPSHLARRDAIFRAIFPGEPADELEYSAYPNVRHDLGSKLSDNALVQFEIVCFCDIPLEEIAIHCSKYGHFGLAFSKSFLIAQGASPVMYIPKPGSFEMVIREHHSASGELSYEERKNGDRANLIDTVFAFHNHKVLYHWFLELQNAVPEADSLDGVMKIVKNLRTTLFYQTAIEAFIFGHLKFFDPTLPPDHADNYYMEREWRVAGKVRFQQADVEHLYVSADFVDRARRDFPDLADRVRALTT